jgi:hypothetical protein
LYVNKFWYFSKLCLFFCKWFNGSLGGIIHNFCNANEEDNFELDVSIYQCIMYTYSCVTHFYKMKSLSISNIGELFNHSFPLFPLPYTIDSQSYYTIEPIKCVKHSNGPHEANGKFLEKRHIEGLLKHKICMLCRLKVIFNNLCEILSRTFSSFPIVWRTCSVGIVNAHKTSNVFIYEYFNGKLLENGFLIQCKAIK